jgi:hypothetical protein
MKTLTLFILLLASCIACDGQSRMTSKVWLPELYVSKFVDKDTTGKNQFIIPIEAIITSDTGTQILTYRGEINPVTSRNIIQNKAQKELLNNVHYYLNQKYLSKDVVMRYSKAEFLLSKHENKLLLEIVEKDKTDSIYFVDMVGNYQFTDVRQVKKFLLSLLN